MPKFYILHSPTNMTYHELTGLQAIARSEFESVSECQTIVFKLLEQHPNMNPDNLHICAVQ